MRSKLDRIRHAILFEVLGLITVVCVLSKLGYGKSHLGVMSLTFSIIATGWNYIYTGAFDRYLFKITGKIEKTIIIRLFQSVGFEFGILIITIPCMAWFLNISLYHALILDSGIVIFYLIYSYGYNFLYDKIYPYE